MKVTTWTTILSALLLATSSAVNSQDYSAPEESGLVAVWPYPTPDDVCQVIGKNDLTINLHITGILIGCPSHEAGAIEDRISEGAIEITQIGTWVLYSTR